MKIIKLFFILSFCVWNWSTFAQTNKSEDESLVFEAEEYSTNIETKITEVKGDVRIVFGGRELKANRVRIDGNNSTVFSEGKILYIHEGLKIEADSGEINFKSGLGTFKNAAITVKEGLYLEGKEITRTALDQYHIKSGKVSPCTDCPQAWSLMGTRIDVTVEGFAEAHHAFFQIKDLPLVYFPFIYMPVKTARQSGFLIPFFRHQRVLGNQFGIPFFWELNDSTDTTLEYAFMTKGGHRFSNEFNYLYSDRSKFSSNVSYVDNDEVPYVDDYRFGVVLSENLQLTKGLTQRLSVEWASDEFYAQDFDQEFKQTRLPSLKNDFSLEQKFKDFQFGVGASVYQNNLPRENYDPVLSQEIHKLPYAYFAYPDLVLWEPFSIDLNVESLSLRRYESEFFSQSLVVDPSSEWIRTGDRVSPQLRINMPLELANKFFYEPSIFLRYDYYHFNDPVEEPEAHRFRSVFQQKLSSNLWSVFDWNGKKLKKIKHVFSPFVRWSYAPDESRSDHEFFDQCDRSFFDFCLRSPKFDLFDPNSDSTSFSLRSYDFEQRMKPHHLASFGFSSRLIGRWSEEDKSYQELLFLNVEQDFDLEKNQTGNIRANIQASTGALSLNGDLFYDFRENELNILNEAIIRFRAIELNTFQEFNDLSKIYGGGVRVNSLGPFSVGTELVYDHNDKEFQEEKYILGYLSSSKCWRADFVLHRVPATKEFDIFPTFQLSYSQAAVKSVY